MSSVSFFRPSGRMRSRRAQGCTQCHMGAWGNEATEAKRGPGLLPSPLRLRIHQEAGGCSLRACLHPEPAEFHWACVRSAHSYYKMCCSDRPCGGSFPAFQAFSSTQASWGKGDWKEETFTAGPETSGGPGRGSEERNPPGAPGAGLAPRQLRPSRRERIAGRRGQEGGGITLGRRTCGRRETGARKREEGVEGADGRPSPRARDPRGRRGRPLEAGLGREPASWGRPPQGAPPGAPPPGLGTGGEGGPQGRPRAAVSRPGELRPLPESGGCGQRRGRTGEARGPAVQPPGSELPPGAAGQRRP